MREVVAGGLGEHRPEPCSRYEQVQLSCSDRTYLVASGSKALESSWVEPAHGFANIVDEMRERLLGAAKKIANVGLRVGPSGEVHLDFEAGGKRLQVAPELFGSHGDCDVPVKGVSASIPVFAEMKSVAPLIDPAGWSQFTSLEMSDQEILGGCSNGKAGWLGTLHEKMEVDILGAKQVVKNKLNIDFCYSDETSTANFSLNTPIEGGITVDHGFVSAKPGGPLSLPHLTAEKTLNWQPGQLPCKLPPSVNTAILSTALTLGLVEYSLRITAHLIDGADLRKEVKLAIESVLAVVQQDATRIWEKFTGH